MKKLLIATAFLMAASLASAQTRMNNDMNVRSSAEAGASNQGVNTNINSYTPDTQTIKNVASIGAPALTTSNDTCHGSLSGGLSIAGAALIGGGTKQDENCVMLKNAREMWNMGMPNAAKARLCANADNRQAMEMTGTKCPQSMTAEERKSVFGQHAYVGDIVPVQTQQLAGTATGPNMNDPYIRSRTTGQPLVLSTGFASK